GRRGPGGELLPAAAEDRARAERRRARGGRRGPGRAAGAVARRGDVERLARRPAAEARMEPEPALAEPVDLRRPDRRGQGGVADGAVLPAGPQRPRGAVVPARRGRRPRPLPARLQPRAGRTVVAAAVPPVRP